jgi:4-hydroxy-3-polyprenylbenzoate decarboxylase
LNADSTHGHVVLAITGASGAAYGLRMLQVLLQAGRHVHLVISPLGRRLLADERDIRTVDPAALAGGAADRLVLYDFGDLGTRLASGTFLTDGMVICPCSSNTLGAIASGMADNCITRAAAVHLKERRRLILVHREMPVSRIDLENMLKVDAAGGIICPASPGFYNRPASIDDLVDFVAGKVLDLLGIPHSLVARWAGNGCQRDSVTI